MKNLHVMDRGLKISVVVPTYNEEDIIYWTIRNLVEQNIYVHVLDNKSTDLTTQIVRRFPSSQVSLSFFHTDGRFNEGIQTKNIQAILRQLETKSDWLIKNDADEFLEAPFCGTSLKEGIELADSLGFNCIGARNFTFFPMLDEMPHIPGEDVRKYYDYFRIWDKVNRWTTDIHPQYNELWKINVYKCRSGVSYFDPHGVSPLTNVVLFPYLFILRHYPYRNPGRTKKRLLAERRDRMSLWNIKNKVSCHYVKYTEEDTFLFDEVKDKLQRWSRFKKHILL